MEIYKLKDFAKWAKGEGVTDATLLRVIDEMNRGLLGDRLGAHVYKKRVGIEGRGKRGGARAILVYKDRIVSLFLYGYMKNEQENISPNEEKQLRLFASEFLGLSRAERNSLVADRKLIAIER